MDDPNTTSVLLALFSGICLGACIGLFFGKIIMRNEKAIPKRKKPLEAAHLPKCNCDDVNQCDTWCRAKYLFAKDND